MILVTPSEAVKLTESMTKEVLRFCGDTAKAVGAVESDDQVLLIRFWCALFEAGRMQGRREAEQGVIA